MDLAEVLDRAAAARPRVAAALAAPHSEEALLAGVVTDLLEAGALGVLPEAFGLTGECERVVLWGADVVSGTDDLAVAAALRDLAPGAGRAVLLDGEPDLVLVTGTGVAVVDATVGRPGHTASRAARGEAMPPARIAALVTTLANHGVRLDLAKAGAAFGTARLAAVALGLGVALGRHPCAIALAGHAEDLLHPQRADLQAWLDAAELVAAGAGSVVELRGLSWLQVAERLGQHAVAEPAVRRIHAHPVLAASRHRLS